MRVYDGVRLSCFHKKSILRFAHLFFEKIVDTIYIVIERLFDSTLLLHVATKSRGGDSLGRLTRTYLCDANDTAVV